MGPALALVILAAAPKAAVPHPKVDGLSPQQLLASARKHVAALDFDLALPFAQELSMRTTAPLEIRIEGYLLLGTTLAIMGDPVGAERPFSALLRLSPDYAPPASLEPRVLSVFKKVLAEERELQQQAELAARARLVASVKVAGDRSAEELKGGQPLTYRCAVTDPRRAVTGVRLMFRPRGTDAFSSIALAPEPEGAWSGTLPAESTASAGGLVLEHFVETHDAAGPLGTDGSAAAPLELKFAAGEVEKPRRPPLPRWLFFGTAALTVAAGAVAGTFAVQYVSAADEYAKLMSDGSRVASGGAYADKLSAAQTSYDRLLGASIVAASLLLITGLVALFVDWSG